MTDVEQERIDDLREAVELAIPVIREAVQRLVAKPASADLVARTAFAAQQRRFARRLEHIARALARANDRWLTDTAVITPPPIGESD